MSSDRTTIAIMEQVVPASFEELSIHDLRFLSSNPRVYAAIRGMTDFADPTSDEKQRRIYDRLLLEPSVKNLIPEIRRDGGLQEPVIVRHDTLEVIEGNSRLAAYRKLHNDADDEDRWNTIRCLIVSTLTDEQQMRLLGQAHLEGRTEWSPYAKALYCFQWIVEKKGDAATLARLCKFTIAEIKKNVRIIQLMQENDDNTLSNFSYYDVLVRNRSISRVTSEDPLLHQTVLSQIRGGAFSALEMRQRLPVIIAKPRILRKFAQGDITLEEAHDRAKISGAEQQLKKARDILDDIQKSDITPLDRNGLRAVEQLIRQANRNLKRVSSTVEAQLALKSGDQ